MRPGPAEEAVPGSPDHAHPVKQEKVSDVEGAARKLFASLRAAPPRGVRVATALLADGVTFVTLLHLDDGVENPLPSLPAYREFLEGLRPCVAEPPVAERGAIVVSLGQA